MSISVSPKDETCAIKDYDLAIIGGGINGTAIAAAAATAGLSTLLLESCDLASGGSSNTLGLLSGDLNLLDQLSLERVRQNLKEQATAQRRAPHLVHPHHFFLLDQPSQRSSRRVKAGMALYRRLQESLTLATNGLAPAKLLRQPQLASHHYLDCSFDSSRYVVAQALLAAEQGADIYNYTPLVEAKRCQHSQCWHLWAQPAETKQQQGFTARTLINASGAHIEDLLTDTMRLESRCQVTHINSISLLVQGLDRAYQQHGFCFQADNHQLIHLLPTQLNSPEPDVPLFRLSCTTPPQKLDEQQQQEWLLNNVNAQLSTPITHAQVLGHSRGQRNLCREAWLKLQTNEVSAEPSLVDFDCRDGHSPLVNIFSSHLSAHRAMAEQVLETLAPYFEPELHSDKIKSHARLSLPGGEFDHRDFDGFLQRLHSDYPTLPSELVKRVALQYGTHARRLLGTRKIRKELGPELAPSLYGFEVDYLKRFEWARTAEDILKRRCSLWHLCTDKALTRVQVYLDTGK